MVSEELVKIYIDNLKHLHFDLQLDLRNQATVEKRRNRGPIYYWQELLDLTSIWSFKISVFLNLTLQLSYLKKHSLPHTEKKLKKEKNGLITSHLQEAKGHVFDENEIMF